MQRLKVLAILKWVQEVSTLSKKGATKVLPSIGGGGHNLKAVIVSFCTPPLPVINDQSLIPLFDIL